MKARAWLSAARRMKKKWLFALAALLFVPGTMHLLLAGLLLRRRKK